MAVLDRTRTQPRKFVRLRPARLDELLAGRGPRARGRALTRRHAAGTAPSDGAPDDPSDPTDQVSGHVAPLEDPLTGEPPVAPPGGDRVAGSRWLALRIGHQPQIGNAPICGW